MKMKEVLNYNYESLYILVTLMWHICHIRVVYVIRNCIKPHTAKFCQQNYFCVRPPFTINHCYNSVSGSMIKPAFVFPSCCRTRHWKPPKILWLLQTLSMIIHLQLLLMLPFLQSTKWKAIKLFSSRR